MSKLLLFKDPEPAKLMSEFRVRSLLGLNRGGEEVDLPRGPAS